VLLSPNWAEGNPFLDRQFQGNFIFQASFILSQSDWFDNNILFALQFEDFFGKEE
jgi:hypothetical protein